MDRESILKEVLAIKEPNILIELPTGTGKSKIAIEKIKTAINSKTLLIVVPRNVHKANWDYEIKKWWPNCSLNITYTTYVSFPKYKGNWDIVIFDEAHHLSERCREALCDFNINYSILLSATVNKNLKDELREVFNNLAVYKKNFRDVIENDILPDPKVHLIRLKLDTKVSKETIIKRPKAKGTPIKCRYSERWKYINTTNVPIYISCTEEEYYSDLCSLINYWKKKYMRTRSQIAKNTWLKLCNDRLKWLSSIKISLIQQLLKNFNSYRTLTFCSSIEQTELLGKYCINSKNPNSIQHLESFNKGKINHITACNILNEGMNLVDCQVGIYANLNSSETIVIQRMGRLLRHPNPILIIPYYIGTREEELVEHMLENYNKSMITVINK